MELNKFKVLTVVGTRPEIIRLSRVIDLLEKRVCHKLVHTGQNYDHQLSEVFFKDLGLRAPDHYLESAAASPAETIANVISRIDPILAKEAPDAFLVLGDTNSCLGAVAAKRRKIPIFHMEAGNRCFDQRVPEEINRKIVDHISDINMPYSTIARDYLLTEGISPDRIIKTGSPMFEVLNHYAASIERSEILSRLKLAPRDYFVASFHREENVDNQDNLDSICDALESIAKKHSKRVIVSTHPRTKQRLAQLGRGFSALIELHEPFGFFDYVKLQKEALIVLSDSGTITEEASILNLRGVNIRQAHERPEGMEEGTVIMTGTRTDRIIQAVEALVMFDQSTNRAVRSVSEYQVPNVSEKVFRIILSYTDYVNSRVWHKF